MKPRKRKYRPYRTEKTSSECQLLLEDEKTVVEKHLANLIDSSDDAALSRAMQTLERINKELQSIKHYEITDEEARELGFRHWLEYAKSSALSHRTQGSDTTK